MVTRITYEGVDSVVELDDRAVTISGPAVTSAQAVGSGEDGDGRSDGTGAGAGADPGDGPGDEDRVVLPRWEVDEAAVEPATLLGYGTLRITARGRRYAVRFSRDAQDRFGDLASLLG